MLIFYLFLMLSYSVPMTLIGIGSVLLNIFVSFYISMKRVNT